MDAGTPRELLPIANATLAWVNAQRHGMQELRRPTPDELRRIELCALATRDAAMLYDLYGGRAPTGHIDHIGGDPHGETEDSQGQRSEAEGLPGTTRCR